VNSGRLPSLAACALIMLMTACVASAPRGERVLDIEGTDVASAVDAFQAIAPIGSQSLVTPPVDRDGMFLDQPPPRSRLTTAEVFRPPQART
jgi:hypothetical protein